MNYRLTDYDGKVAIIGAIEWETINGNTIAKCGFSWNNKEEANERVNSNHCIIMTGRSEKEGEVQILQSAWVTIGKDYYKEQFGLPQEIENLDVQYNCFTDFLRNKC